MEFSQFKNPFDEKRMIDAEFTNLLRGVGSVHFISEDDIKLERQALLDIERLTQELNPESYKDSASSKNVQTPTVVSGNDESVIGTLVTRGSRRKRTLGADGSRPVTAPAIKPTMKQNSIEPKIMAKTGFEFQRPISAAEEIKVKPDEEIITSENMHLKLLETQLANQLSQRERILRDQQVRFDNQLKQDVKLLEIEQETNLQQLKEWFEAKRNTLEGARRQQEKLSSLSQTISKNTQTVSGLSNQFMRAKNYDENLKEQELISKEKQLDIREQKITIQLAASESEKQKLLIKKTKSDEDAENRRMMIWKEKEFLVGEFEKLEKFQDYIKEYEQEQKKEFAFELHRVSLLKEEQETEEKSM